MGYQKFFMFPGQGSQRIGMLSGYAEHPIVKDVFSEASDILGFDVWKLSQEGPETQLNQTEYTQPVILTASIALWRVSQSTGLTGDILAGHSLGEFTALVAADAMSFEDAVQLVRFRGQLMQAAVPEGKGAMCAVLGLDDDKVIECCKEVAGKEIVEAVNFNSPGQVVIAGHANAVERAASLCQTAGAKRVIPLPVSVPSHCALMKPAAERLKRALEDIDIRTPKLPVIRNVDATLYASPGDIRDGLYRQLFSAVRWTQTLQFVVESGVEAAYECGPGKVLCGLMKRVARRLPTIDLESELLNSLSE